MNLVLNIGFRSFYKLSSFAEFSRVFNVGKLILLSPRLMRPRSLYSMSSEDQGKLIEPITVEPPLIKAEKGSVKENAVKGKNIISENQIVEDDPDSLAKVTVQQLRLKLRSVVPARGSKRDLLSALKSVLESKVDEEVSWVLNDGTSSKMEQDCSNDNLKRKAKRSSASKHTHTINAVSEDHSLKRTKSAVNKKMTGDNIVEVESTVHRTKKKSIETYDISARKLSSRKRNIVSETASGVDLGVSNTVDLSANHSEPLTILAHKKPQKGWIPYNPKTMRPPPPPSNIKNVKLMSWNVNGLRALLKLEGFSALELAQRENFDVLCFQETKLQEKDVEVIKETLLEGYENSFWTCSISKLGYSGTAIISRIKPLSVRYGLGISDHDSEGRLVTAEFDSFYLLSGYVPNSGERLKRLSYKVSE